MLKMGNRVKEPTGIEIGYRVTKWANKVNQWVYKLKKGLQGSKNGLQGYKLTTGLLNGPCNVTKWSYRVRKMGLQCQKIILYMLNSPGVLVSPPPFPPLSPHM